MEKGNRVEYIDQILVREALVGDEENRKEEKALLLEINQSLYALDQKAIQRLLETNFAQEFEKALLACLNKN